MNRDGRHILVCSANTVWIRREGRSMPEQEEKQTAPSTTPIEDVDDLIFRTEPGWLASER